MTYQLPEPAKQSYGAGTKPTAYYTASQMQAAYAAGVAAEREACANLCDAHATGWENNPGRNPMAGYVATSNCAFDIRARGEDMSDLEALRGIQGVGL